MSTAPTEPVELVEDKRQEAPIPLYVIDVSEAEFARAGEVARGDLEYAVGRLQKQGYFAPDGRPSKEWAFVDLSEFEGFNEFLRRCRKIHTGNAVRDALRADRHGYYSKFFDDRTFIADIVAINMSAPERQGGPMTEMYKMTIEERGGYPEVHRQPSIPSEPLAWNRWFGIFRHLPGHTQGDVVVDEQLVAYITLRRVAACAYYSTIIGHADHLEHGVMYKMHLDLVDYLLAQRTSARSDDQQEDVSVEGLRFLLYANYFVRLGLRQWKRRMLFRPGYFLFRYPGQDNAGSEG